jgi:hypothetical protein
VAAPGTETAAAHPAGAHHAAPAANPVRTLCGADTTGWHVFPEQAFDPAEGAACLRCAHMTAGPRRPLPTQARREGQPRPANPSGS